MKGRNILIVLASIMILFNGLVYLSGNMKVPETSSENKIAFIIGYNFSFILGLILLGIAFFVHKKVNRKRRKKMIDSFLQ